MNTDPRRITLTPEQQAELADVSAATGKPWPEVLQEALTTYRKDNGPKNLERKAGESFLEAASRLGLIGCVSSGLGDLSTNPKYMEGFGESDD